MFAITILVDIIICCMEKLSKSLIILNSLQLNSLTLLSYFYKFFINIRDIYILLSKDSRKN